MEHPPTILIDTRVVDENVLSIFQTLSFDPIH